MKKYSYPEAYTDFLHYCEKKLNIKFETLLNEYRNNGIESKFKEIYNGISTDLTSAQYYKLLNGGKHGTTGYTKK